MKYIKKFEQHSDYEVFRGWVEYVTPNVSYCVNEDEVHYNPYVYDPILKFTAEEANSTIKLNRVGTATTLVNASLQYSTDNGETWNDYTIGDPITLTNVGDSVKFKGTNATLGVNDSNYHYFVMTGNISAKGDVTSLLNETGGNCTLSQSHAFYGLFQNCKSLTTAPELPSIILSTNCYRNMFKGCTSLTTAPELPAKNLENYCYANMFQGCTSLTAAPELPSATLASYCYQYMFQGCTSLTAAPELPAATLVTNCYSYMFNGCSNLNYIKALFVTTPKNSYTNNWVNGVKSMGTFEKSVFATWNVTGVNGVPSNWTLSNPQYEFLSNNELLTFTAEETNSTITFNKSGTATTLANADLQYSTDGGNNWYGYTLGNIITLSNVGDSVKFKGTNSSLAVDADNYHQFVMTGKISSHGKITSLLTLQNVYYLPSYGYAHLFENCTSLTTAPELPATTLANNCYSNMFQGCTSLTAAPELPATTLANNCYFNMFQGCTSLTATPELPSTTLANYCYGNMFSGCTSLTAAPELPATTLAHDCYFSMFQGCTSLTAAPELPATTLSGYCYYSMFQGCTSLTAAPELPATTLANSCYQKMFIGCTSLTAAPELPSTTLAFYCYENMFSGCTSLTAAPELPAITLANYCYRYMFQGCSNLSYIKAMFTTTPSATYTISWVSGVKSTGTFIKNSAATWDVTGINGIPEGWTVETANVGGK